MNKLGNMQVSNRNSDIQIYLPDKAAFQVDARSRGGEIESDFDALKIDNGDDQATATGIDRRRRPASGDQQRARRNRTAQRIVDGRVGNAPEAAAPTGPAKSPRAHRKLTFKLGVPRPSSAWAGSSLINAIRENSSLGGRTTRPSGAWTGHPRHGHGITFFHLPRLSPMQIVRFLLLGVFVSLPPGRRAGRCHVPRQIWRVPASTTHLAFPGSARSNGSFKPPAR